jgi:Domain of unknown function (DUF4037)
MDSGIELSRRFYGELLHPWLAEAFPGLRHAAALIGAGSELLGFDDEMSRDHDWGPRLQIFVSETDFAAHAHAIVSRFAEVIPETFLGAQTAFRDQAGHGLEVWTLELWLRRQLSLELDEPRDNLAWLGLAEQRLLGLTAGAVFRDDGGRLTAVRARLAVFPSDVRLYKLACQWRRIAEEQAFVGRTGASGDDLGSRIIAARLARDVMRMAFLIEDRYAPYPKWFGKAFAALPCAPVLTPALDRVLAAPDWKPREAALAEAYLALARLHRERGLGGDFEPAIGAYFSRPFTVINADDIAGAIRSAIADPVLHGLPLLGSLDQITDATPVIEAPDRARRAIAALFDDGES